MAEAVVAGAQPSASASWMLLGLGLATGMEFYGGDSMNLVLPDIVGSLGVSPDEGSWILTVYTSALFFGVPVSIWMGTHFGYRRYLLTAVTTFAIGSIGCAMAPDLTQMLFWRAVQGFAAGGLYVWWRASIYVLLPKSARSPSLMRVSTILYLSSAARARLQRLHHGQLELASDICTEPDLRRCRDRNPVAQFSSPMPRGRRLAPKTPITPGWHCSVSRSFRCKSFSTVDRSTIGSARRL